MTSIQLDRIALEDVGVNPQRLAEAIHEQLGEGVGAVPVRQIALALDIVDIRELPLTNFEAALVTTPERDCGEILLNLNSSPQRRRFSLGHELLHFLNSGHEQTEAGGFWCSRADMMTSSATQNRHVRQEAEANAFAIELLAPRKRLRPYLRAKASLQTVLRIASDLDISREAAARRYVNLQSDGLAAVFCKNGQFVYAERGSGFPKLSLRSGQPLDVGSGPEGSVSDFEEVDLADWLSGRPRVTRLSMQTLQQRNSHSITLLKAIVPEDEDDLGFDDAYERLARWRAR